jgi:hypothetical protein
MPYAVAVLLTRDETEDGSLRRGACKIARQVRRMTDVDLVMLTLAPDASMAACGWRQRVVPAIDNPDPNDHSEYARGKVYTKLHLWNLTEYERVLFLDLDTLPVAQFAQLFEQRLGRHCEGVGAMVLDVGHVDYYNAGVMLVLPNKTLWRHLVGNVTLVPHDSMFPEQNYLNAFLKGRICALPRKYNAIVTDRARFGPTLVIVHYTNIKVRMRLWSWWRGLNDLVASWDLA